MIETKSNIFELGRGAKLIPMEYWHQFVLGFDSTNQDAPFVVSEVGKTGVLFTKNISLNELRSDEWTELLEVSECHQLVEQYSIDSERFVMHLNEVRKTIEMFEGEWISTKEIEVLTHNSNFGNWVSAVAIPGNYRFSLKLDTNEPKNSRIDIPVEYASGGPGTYGIHYGRFELTLNQILIWQNEVFPTGIKYKWVNDILELEIFEKQIQFIKEKLPTTKPKLHLPPDTHLQ